MTKQPENGARWGLIREQWLQAACFALCFLGIRGRTGRSPIRVSAAYYCSDPVLNQLGVAPMFNLMNSLKDDMREENAELRLMDYAAATAHMRSYLGCAGRADSAAILRRSVPAATALYFSTIFLCIVSNISGTPMNIVG